MAERPANAALPSLFLVGDSTVRSGGANGAVGWGERVALYFDPARVNVVNHAIGGRSSRTFLGEGRWARVMEQVKAGDAVLIQFGHNDGGRIGDPAMKGRASGAGLGPETVEDRRPCRFTYSISRVARRKMPWSFCFGINKMTPRRRPIHESFRAGVVVAGRIATKRAPLRTRSAEGTGRSSDLELDWGYTVSRARPLARRRAITLRPFFVLIRFRNPCSRFRLSLDGC